jgi:hypothetical protein
LSSHYDTSAPDIDAILEILGQGQSAWSHIVYGYDLVTAIGLHGVLFMGGLEMINMKLRSSFG